MLGTPNCYSKNEGGMMIKGWGGEEREKLSPFVSKTWILWRTATMHKEGNEHDIVQPYEETFCAEQTSNQKLASSIQKGCQGQKPHFFCSLPCPCVLITMLDTE